MQVLLLALLLAQPPDAPTPSPEAQAAPAAPAAEEAAAPSPQEPAAEATERPSAVTDTPKPPPPQRAAPRAPARRLPPPPLGPPASGPEGADESLLQVAGDFFTALHRSDAAAASRLSHAPFQLEAERLEAQADVGRRWRELLGKRPLAGTELRGVEAQPLQEMVERHGPPPARLGTWEPEGTWVAIANVDGRAHVALLQRHGGAWRVVAYTD